MTVRLIPIERKPLREYDEHLLCLSESGLIRLLSFGSRSPKSSRGKALSELAWLEVNIERQKIAVLKSIVKITPIIPLDDFGKQDFNFYIEFSSLLREVATFFPKNNHQANHSTEVEIAETEYRPDQNIYQLLIQLSSNQVQQLQLSLLRLRLLFKLSLLKEFGILGEFVGCQHSQHIDVTFTENANHKFVDEKYFFVDGEYWCSQCIKSKNHPSHHLKNSDQNNSSTPLENYFKFQTQINLKSLLILNLFLKKYQLNEEFFQQFGVFLNSNKVSDQEIQNLLNLSEQIKLLINR